MVSPKLVLVLTLIFCSSTYAEQPEPDNKPDLDTLVSQLKLDETKARQLKTIVESHRQQIASMREQRKKRHEIREQHRVELLTVLSHEQLYKFEQYMHNFQKGQLRN